MKWAFLYLLISLDQPNDLILPLNGMCDWNQMTFSWRTGKSTSYHADYLISNVSQKREFYEKVQG